MQSWIEAYLIEPQKSQNLPCPDLHKNSMKKHHRNNNEKIVI